MVGLPTHRPAKDALIPELDGASEPSATMSKWDCCSSSECRCDHGGGRSVDVSSTIGGVRRYRHARLPPFVNIWRGRVTTNSVNSSTSLSTVIVPPCCFVTMS